MGTANSLLIISDSHEEIIKFQSKLMLLRNVDSVIESIFDSAIENCKKHIPDTIIIFTEKGDQRAFEICKNVRHNALLKNTPILFVLKSFDEECVLSGFDAGISDYITLPARDSDILMRVIWCLQKSETARDIEKKQNLLSDLGVINKEMNAYTPEFTAKVFSNEILAAQKYRYPIALMAVKSDDANDNKIDNRRFAKIINKSVRNSDILGISEDDIFYMILPKTDKNGICTVYERIVNNLKDEITISAGACNLYERMTYDDLSSRTLIALKKAMVKGNSLIIEEAESINKNEDEGWIDKVHNETKNFKLFKQAFNKKLKNIVEPVFYKMYNELQSKYPEKAIIEHYMSGSKCIFSIKDPFVNNEVNLKITDPGFSKVIIDVLYIKQGEQHSTRSKIDLNDLTENNLINIINAMADEFEKLVEKEKV
jgi:DNA-binding response OmpR family regulator